MIDGGGRQAGRVRTGPEGSFAIPVSAPGTYTLIAIGAGHEPYASAVQVGERPLERLIELAGGGSLAGTVRAAATGTPLAGAAVTLLGADGEVVAARTTDAAGRYEFGGAPPGSYTLAMTAPSCELPPCRW